MDDSNRKQRIIDLEAQYRRTETALAVAQAAHEQSYADLWSFMNETTGGPNSVLSFSPELTMH